MHDCSKHPADMVYRDCPEQVRFRAELMRPPRWRLTDRGHLVVSMVTVVTIAIIAARFLWVLSG